MQFNLLTNGLLKISGVDAGKFLQGQVTCDIREIGEKQSRLAAYCNHKGKVLVIFRIFSFQDSYHLAFPHALLEKTLSTLKKYAVFSEVVIEDLSKTWASIGVLSSKPLFGLERIDVANLINDAIYIRVPADQQQYRYEIYCPASQIQSIVTTFTGNGSTTISDDAWKLSTLKAGVPLLTAETSEQFTPHMLNLPALDAVSFNKGCYLGQEIIARTEHLGQVKRHLKSMILTAEKPILPNMPIMQDHQEVARVLDAVQIDSTRYLALTVSS